jgi:hypothetical protein
MLPGIVGAWYSTLPLPPSPLLEGLWPCFKVSDVSAGGAGIAGVNLAGIGANWLLMSVSTGVSGGLESLRMPGVLAIVCNVLWGLCGVCWMVVVRGKRPVT